MRKSLPEQLRKLTSSISLRSSDLKWIPVFLGLMIFLTLFYLAMYQISKYSGIPLETFTRDVFAVVLAPVYTGIVSNLGMLFWMAAATVCLFTAASTAPPAGSRNVREDREHGMILFAGLFTFVLTMDDYFMVHEKIFPDMLGVPEKYIFLFYLVCMAAYLIRYFTCFLDGRVWVLAAGLAGFAGSMAIDSLYLLGDMFNEEKMWRIVVFENYFKLIGTACWAFYFFLVCRDRVKRLSRS